MTEVINFSFSRLVRRNMGDNPVEEICKAGKISSYTLNDEGNAVIKVSMVVNLGHFKIYLNVDEANAKPAEFFENVIKEIYPITETATQIDVIKTVRDAIAPELVLTHFEVTFVLNKEQTLALQKIEHEVAVLEAQIDAIEQKIATLQDGLKVTQQAKKNLNTTFTI